MLLFFCISDFLSYCLGTNSSLQYIFSLIVIAYSSLSVLLFVCACVFLQAVPVSPSGVPISDRPFTRTSLLGFVGPVSFALSICPYDASAVLLKN